jgi:hypothetical protein
MPRTEPSHNIPDEALPAALRELVRVLGDADALRLIGQLGGARITVPTKATSDHKLRLALSAEGFERLVAEYTGEVLELPKGDAYLRVLRHDQVRLCREQGMTVDETAEQTGYSRRHVINIIGGHGAGVDEHTMDMFDEPDEQPKERKKLPGRQLNDPFGLTSWER